MRILIETSPLAILTLDESGAVALANESAGQLLGFEDECHLPGRQVEPFLPLLPRMLHSHRSGQTHHNIRTSVECSGQRRNGEVFLAHVWLSTYRTSKGPGLAAVVWDASENLRDREGAGLDSMMATSRVLIGAVSHEIRNLASAAATAYAALAAEDGGGTIGTVSGARIADPGAGENFHVGLAHGFHPRGGERPTWAPCWTKPASWWSLRLRDAGISADWHAQEGLPLVQADHHSLLQVFVNLARNSLRALRRCAAPRIARHRRSRARPGHGAFRG